MPVVVPVVLVEKIMPDKVVLSVCSCSLKGVSTLCWLLYSATSLPSSGVDELAGSLTCTPCDFGDEQPGL